MKGPFRGPILWIAGAALAVVLAALSAHPAHAIRDSTAVFDANAIRMGVSNLGWIVPPLYDSEAVGLEWLPGSGWKLVYGAGLWIGGRVGVDTIVTTSEYVSRWAAGPLDANGLAVDPGQSDPSIRVESLRRCGPPGLIPLRGDQTLASVYNDSRSGRPIGIEVEQTVYGFDRGDPINHVVFVSFVVRNRGSETLDEAYAGFWLDVELGGAGDDLVGCDSTLDLGFGYNGDDDDVVFGAFLPAIGCAVLQGPIVGSDTLGMTSFGRLIKNYNEPITIGEAYRRMARGTPHPSETPPFACDAPGDRFEVSGDPVTGAGCLDELPADRRMLLSTGPFTLAPGDSQTIVIGLAVGYRGDRLSSINELRATVAEARELHRSGYAGQPPPLNCDASVQSVFVWPNPTRDAHHIALRFGGLVRRLDLGIHDVTGRRVWRQSVEDVRLSMSFSWNGVDDDGVPVPAGIYWLRADDGRRRFVTKLVLLR